MAHACSQYPRPDPSGTYRAQDGYVFDHYAGTWTPNFVLINNFTAHPECMYDKKASDPGCATCQHNQHRKEQ